MHRCVFLRVLVSQHLIIQTRQFFEVKFKTLPITISFVWHAILAIALRRSARQGLVQCREVLICCVTSEYPSMLTFSISL